jgi:hypothetical protein
MEALQTSTESRAAPGGAPSRGKKFPRNDQPADVLNVPGALLKLETLSRLSGDSIATLYRAAKRGDLVLTKWSVRNTRVTSENARAYLARRVGGAA